MESSKYICPFEGGFEDACEETLDSRRGGETKVLGGEMLAGSGRPGAGALSSSDREEGQRSENFPGLSPASATARQPRPWSGRYGRPADVAKPIRHQMKSLAIPLEAPSGKRSMSDEQIINKGKALLVRPWTEEDDAQLVDMVAQKRHRSIIAASLRRTSQAITSRLRVLRRRERIEPA